MVNSESLEESKTLEYLGSKLRQRTWKGMELSILWSD